MMTLMCQCEHASHFPDTGQLSPNGNPNHKFGVKYAVSYMTEIKTSYGAYFVCRDCLHDCWDEKQKANG